MTCGNGGYSKVLTRVNTVFECFRRFWVHFEAAEVLVASHDKAFLESLEVTDKILVKRDVIGQPGTLKVSWLLKMCVVAICFSQQVSQSQSYLWCMVLT